MDYGRFLHKTIGIASASVALALVATVAWLLTMPATAECSRKIPASNMDRLDPKEVFVRPWFGQHQVYGIFMIPNGSNDNGKYGVMTVLGFSHRLKLAQESDRYYPDRLLAEPGHYVKRGYVPTRVALWFLFTGRFGDLRDPCNWALVFIEGAP